MDTSILKKKVAGVPVIYPAVAFVGVLVFFAWRMKGADVEGDNPVDEDGEPVDDDMDYSKLASNGTVTVSQGSDPATVTPIVVETNTTWMNKGITYLATQGYGAGESQEALAAYINGNQLTFDQGKLRDAVIKQYGLPPEPPTPGGTSDPKPTRQGNPPLVHTVQGSSDNSYNEIAQIYYGRKDSVAIDLLQSKNSNLGHAGGAWAKGTKVNVPVYSPPVYFTATSSVRTMAQIAAKHGISQAVLEDLNDGMKFPVAVGKKVRVR